MKKLVIEVMYDETKTPKPDMVGTLQNIVANVYRRGHQNTFAEGMCDKITYTYEVKDVPN